MAYICTYSDLSADIRWRLILGLGSVPALFVVLFTLLEARYDDGSRIVRRTEFDKEPISLMDSLSDRKNLMKLVATGGGWFLYDVAFYGVNLFAGDILDAMNGDDDNVSSDHSIRDISSKQIIANSMGIPACIFTILLMKPVGIKRLQVVGFVLIAIAFVLMACLFDPLKQRNPDLLFAFYCLLLFFLSFGPNATTYVLSSEVYPKEIRATFNGISAAAGKVGAALGAYLFGPMADGTSLPTVMIFCAVISVIGALVSEYFIDISEDDSVDYKVIPDGREEEEADNRKHGTVINVLHA